MLLYMTNMTHVAESMRMRLVERAGVENRPSPRGFTRVCITVDATADKAAQWCTRTTAEYSGG